MDMANSFMKMEIYIWDFLEPIRHLVKEYINIKRDADKRENGLMINLTAKEKKPGLMEHHMREIT